MSERRRAAVNAIAKVQAREVEPCTPESIARAKAAAAAESAAWLAFRRELAASGQVQAIAELLWHTHWLMQGWPGQSTPLPPAVAPAFRTVAERAIRSCDDVACDVARHQAEDYGVMIFDRLEAVLRSCDTTPQRREQLIKVFVCECLTVERQALTTPGRTALEMAEYRRHEGDER
jgi:hypothetical protein